MNTCVLPQNSKTGLESKSRGSPRVQRLLATKNTFKKCLITQSRELGPSHSSSFPQPEISSCPSAKDTNPLLHNLQALLRKFTTACCTKHGQRQDWAPLHPSAPPQARNSFPQASMSLPVPRQDQPMLTRCFLAWAG